MNKEKDTKVKAKQPKRKFKRLFFDIETSPNLVFSWNVGRKISIDYDNIIRERAIICVCWKWEGESKVHSLKWNKGDDKQLVQQFTKVMQEADECVGHNSVSFDTNWLRTRALYHNIPMLPEYTAIDTLKESRKSFKFNSNRLDYISKFLGIGKKKETGFGLWKAITMNNDSQAMTKMVKYCQNDVKLLETVFKRLNPYIKHKTHVGILMKNNSCSCPECASTNVHGNGIRVKATGIRVQRMKCADCGKHYQLKVTQ